MVGNDAAVAALVAAGFSHGVWVPDSFFGAWEEAFDHVGLPLLRVTREGEGIALAAGLMLGGARPVVILQSTGLFEAGDALRNVVYDLQLPLKLLVGLRSYRAFQAGHSQDSAARWAEAVVQAWQLPYQLIDPMISDPAVWAAAMAQLAQAPGAAAVLVTE
jgi:phosphonopyruvate decarboxylase